MSILKQIVFFVLFLPVILFSQDTSKLSIVINEFDIKDGDYETFYDNGQLKSKGFYVKGNKEGVYKWWYSNGNLERQGNYILGKKNGVYKWWYSNGQIYVMGNYKNGILLNENSCWDENGNKILCE